MREGRRGEILDREQMNEARRKRRIYRYIDR